jgi:hypothetical protein
MARRCSFVEEAPFGVSSEHEPSGIEVAATVRVVSMRILPGEPPILVFSAKPLEDVTDDNVDIEVRLLDGTRWSATVFTVDNLRSLMAKWRSTGECSGRYVSAADMIVVERLSDSGLRELVDELVAEGTLKDVLMPLPDA